MTERLDRTYDVIVVGARAAGAATGMLLARRGLDVLVVDRSAYGADTLSTHALMRAGVLQLSRWGLLGAIEKAGTPPVRRTVFDYGDEQLDVHIRPSTGVDALYAPRRTVLDRALVDAARAAGADVRFRIAVKDVLRDDRGRVIGVHGSCDNGRRFEARARLVIGADGMRSRIARAVDAETVRQGSASTAVIYGYFDDLDAVGYEWSYRPGVASGLIPTNDGATCVFAGTTEDRFARDVRGNLAFTFWNILEDSSPEKAERVRAARQVGRFRGFPGLRGWIRRPWGEGWALVGDAAYFKDPISAHGITDALRDAELLARAVERGLGGTVPESEALAVYERTRDELSHDLFDAADEIARYDWDMVKVRELLKRMSRGMKPEVGYLERLDDAPVAERVA